MSPDLKEKLKSLTPEGRERLLTQLKQRKQRPSSIPKAAISETYPLSVGQQRLWRAEQFLENKKSAYNVSFSAYIHGDLDKSLFQQSWAKLIEKHEVLRMYFTSENEVPQMRVHAKYSPEIHFENWSRQSHAKSEFIEFSKKKCDPRFDLKKAPLYHIYLIQLEDELWGLHFVMHHIITDGWSAPILMQDLALYYKNEQIEEHRLSGIEYHDFAVWQNQQQNSERWKSSLAFWQEYLKNTSPLQLPCLKTGSEQKNIEGSHLRKTFSQRSGKALKLLCKQNSASEFHILIACLGLLLGRHSNKEDITIGTAVAGRTTPELENLTGFFVNLLPIRVQINDEITIKDLIKTSKQSALSALKHQEVPYDLIVDQQTTYHKELFDVFIVLQNNRKAGMTLGDAKIESIPLDGETAQFPLTFNFEIDEDAIDLLITYKSKLFGAKYIEDLATQFEFILANANHHLDKQLKFFSILPQNNLEEILRFSNANNPTLEKQETISELFYKVCSQYPDNNALKDGKSSWTYKELELDVQRYKGLIKDELSQKAFPVVAVHLPRCAEAIISMLAIMDLGAVYLPLDPKLPDERKKLVLENSQAGLIINGNDPLNFSENKVIHIEEFKNRDKFCNSVSVRPENTAYLIYTSGSTGIPKGVRIDHKSFCAMIVEQIKTFNLHPNQNVAQFASLSFDASISEVFMALLSGACLEMVPEIVKLSSADFSEWLVNHHIDAITLPPTYLSTFGKRKFNDLKTLITAGETAISKDVHFHSQYLNYFNAYGPTETSVCATIHKVSPYSKAEVIPIGKPIKHTACFVLDKNQQLCPVEVEGELYIGGESLAKDYFGDSNRTKVAFVNIEIPGVKNCKLYKTGDKVRWNKNGELVFCGRVDFQVKINGYRIEPEEIDASLASNENILKSLTVDQKDKFGSNYLVSYYKSRNKLSPQELRGFLRQKLPAYMIPTHFIEIDEFSLTTSGKIDRKKLPSSSKKDSDEIISTPRNSIEKSVLCIWKEILDKPDIDINDSFFDLGGNSLKAMQLIEKINQNLIVELPPSSVLESHTISLLSQQVLEFQEYKYSDQTHVILNKKGEKTLFAFPPIGASHAYIETTSCLDGFTSILLNIDFTNPIDICCETIKKIQPEGPYYLVGYSAGGNLAFNVAQTLENQGEKINKFLLIDSRPRHCTENINEVLDSNDIKKLEKTLSQLILNTETKNRIIERQKSHLQYHTQNIDRGQIKADIHLILSEESDLYLKSNDPGAKLWKNHTNGNFHKYTGKGDHLNMLRQPHVSRNVEIFKNILEV